MIPAKYSYRTKGFPDILILTLALALAIVALRALPAIASNHHESGGFFGALSEASVGYIIAVPRTLAKGVRV